MEKLTIQIESNKVRQEPAVLEGVQWETSRKGEPSKLTFTVIKDDGLSFSEGSPVRAWLGDYGFFSGYVFEKSRNKEQHIQVTAYDQLRYLKAKHTYVMSGVRADQVVQRIAKDFKLECGELENTKFILPPLSQANKTLFDIILDAIDDTARNTNELFYLYDDFGKLTLKNIKSSRTNFIINSETAEDFDYSSSIDSETYNSIVLVTKSKDKGSSTITVRQDPTNIRYWGVLQHYEEVDSGVNANQRADALLKFHNRVSRSLVIKNHVGDVKIRAGSGVILDLNLGDKIMNDRFLVDKAVHRFDNDKHFMDLTLNGCEEFYE